MLRKNYFNEQDYQTVVRNLRLKPSLLEKEYKALNQLLERHSVRLSVTGEVDYSLCQSKSLVTQLKEREEEVKLALYFKDM